MSSAPAGADLDALPGGIPRPLDAALAALGFVLCSPLLAAVALAVRLTSPGPVLFRQRRVGRDGVEFTLLKFRTMRVNQRQGTLSVTSQDDPRITPLGRWLRRLKIDELPELWNIVRGDMALVGPRPEVPRYVEVSNPLWRRVLRARPGLTDPVTLRLRNEEQLIATAPGAVEDFYLGMLQPYKLAGYMKYLERRSFAGDLVTLLRTLLAVVVPAVATPPSLDEMRAVIAENSQEPSPLPVTERESDACRTRGEPGRSGAVRDDKSCRSRGVSMDDVGVQSKSAERRSDSYDESVDPIK